MKNPVRSALRIRNMITEIEKRHGENQAERFTYWGGFDLGYLKGQLSVIEEMMSEEEFQEYLEAEKHLDVIK